MSLFEQRANFKFGQRLGKFAPETLEIIIRNVYGQNALSRSKVSEVFVRFKEGRKCLDEKSHVAWAVNKISK